MKVKVLKDSNELGKEAAMFSAKSINKAIAEKGKARIVLSTGASQFDTLKYLVKMNVDWQKVEIFHLDEYIGLPEDHPASFRRYLKDRFITKVHPGHIHLIEGDAKDPEKECERLNAIIIQKEIDVAFVGIGENGHLAFNDPPADFNTEKPYIIVELDDACRRQQLGEGWFKSFDDVPKKAISMSVKQIMKSKHIICTVPDKRKAEAVKNCFKGDDISPECPASILKKHDNCFVFLDNQSSVYLK